MSSWPGPSPVALGEDALQLAGGELPFVVLGEEVLSLAGGELSSVAHVGDARLSAGATMEASGMAPEGGFGMAVGGHTA